MTPDLAFVELNGSRFYLGAYGTEESRKEYRRVLIEWEAAGHSPPVAQEGIQVVEVAARFWTHAEGYYRRPDRTQTSEVASFRTALRALNDQYGHTKANDFGPRALKAIRSALVAKGLARTTVNATIRRVKSVFKWAVAEELVDSSVYQALQTVEGLKRGRSEARETDPVKPVSQAHVDAIQPYVSRQVWAVVQLQQFTGARSGEILEMRACAIDTSGHIWMYRPSSHKNAHREQDRVIYLGPRAQAVIRPFLAERPFAGFLFSPREAERERLERRHAERCTPENQGNCPGTNRRPNPSWRPGERYTKDPYRQAIVRACKRAGIPPWHPHQLRHAAGKHIRREFGVDEARVILGHATLVTTDVYSALDKEKALKVVEAIG